MALTISKCPDPKRYSHRNTMAYKILLKSLLDIFLSSLSHIHMFHNNEYSVIEYKKLITTNSHGQWANRIKSTQRKNYCLKPFSAILNTFLSIIHEIFEPNCSFLVKQRTTRSSSFWQGESALGYHSMEFIRFLDISQFPKILSLKLFRNSPGNSYLACL